MLKWWLRFQEFLNVKGDVVMLAMSTAVIYQIFRGHDVGVSNAACYATAITAFAATKINRNNQP